MAMTPVEREEHFRLAVLAYLKAINSTLYLIAVMVGIAGGLIVCLLLVSAFGL